MMFLTELIVWGERIELGSFYDRVCLGQVYEIQKWIYFEFIVIYICLTSLTRAKQKGKMTFPA